MRKSFTRLFSIFVLLLGLSFQMAYGIVFDGTKSVPVDGTANAKPTDFATKFVVAFDVVPQITDAGGTVVIYKNSGLFKTIPISKTSANVLVVGKTLEITHGITTFTAGESYSVAITDGAITSLAAGALANGVYDFVVGDYVAPKLLTTPATAYTPNLGAVDVPFGPMAPLVIPFDEPVNVPATPGNKAVYVYKADGTIVDIIKVSTIAGLPSATVSVPVAATAILAENTSYYVVIDEGAFVDASPNKNAFGGLSTKTTWVFSTQDNSAPAISAKSVTSVTATSATLNVTLAEAGKYYYGVYPAASTPSVANVVAGTGAVVFGNKTVAAAAVGSNVTAALAGLTGSTAYKAFVVSENSVGVKSLTVESVAFTTVDNTPPTSIARGTLRDASKKTYALYMVFDEQMKGDGTGTLDLRKNSDESYVKSVASSAITSRKITSAEVTANTFGAGRTTSQYVTVIDLGMTLATNTAYYVVFPAGYLKDLAGNDFAGAGSFIVPINKTDWAFTSSDFEVPTVTAAWVTPASLGSDIALTFSETIQKQLSTTTDWADVIALELNNTPVPFTVTSPAAAGQGTVITINPTPATLTSNTTYTVRLRKIAVMDISDNANKITTEQVFNLTTGNLDALTATYGSSVGATAVTNLVATSTLKIKFNKGIKVNTTGTTWVAADATNLAALMTFKKGATAKTFTVAYDATTFTATVTPTDALVSNAADYILTVDEAKIKDVADITVPLGAGINTITYTVKDFLAPVVTVSHTGNVENLVANANPTITFADDNIGTITNLTGTALTALTASQIKDMVTFKDGSSSGANLSFTAAYAGGVITITPTVALATGKTYYYGIGASVKDATGNAAPATFSTFTMVAPVVSPAITAVTYTVNGSAQTPIATKLVNITPNSSSKVVVTVNFNDNVKEVVSVAPYNTVSLTDGTNTWTADVTPTSVSGNTLSVSFTTTATLAAAIDAGTECTLTLPAGIVRGSTAYAPTLYAAFAGATIKFDSKDITAPVVTAANTYDSTTPTPVLSTTAVALNTKLELVLGEKVVLGAGDILIKVGTTTVQTIPVNSTNVTLNTAGTLATVVKADLTKYNTLYSVVVPAGAFKDDISLNSNAAATFTFTTLLNPQPVVTATGYSPADNSDLLPTAGTLTLSLTFSEDVIKYDPLVGSRKQWFLVKNTGTIATPGTRASFGPLNDLVAGTDVVVANNYIETSSVGINGPIVSIATGFVPVAGEKYYVLITPGSFLDKSEGTTAVGNEIPGVFTGITSDATWNFTTKDENPGTVSFTYTKRADNKVTKTSDIVINFTRPIKNGDGTAITDSQIATLFTLTKTAGSGTLGTKAFVGTISADKKTVTILNSSLVTLGEMTELASYTIALTGSAIYANGTAITGASDAFSTSDYTAPAVVPSIAAPITDVVYNTTTSQHEATVTFTCTDNVGLASVYYTIQPGDATTLAPAAAVVKADKVKAIVGASPQVTTYKFTGLAEETSYVVWAVAVDAAGNESVVNGVVFVTDDKTKPTLVTLPTSFDAAGKLTFGFSEAVTGAASSVRILDAATMTELAVLGLNPVLPSSATNDKKLITDAFAGLATGNTPVNYYVEIDKGLVSDVPVVAGDAVNTFDGLYRTALMVTSKDAVLPTLVSVTMIKSTTDPSIYSAKMTFSEPVRKVTTLPANAIFMEGPAFHVPFEVVDAANIITNGTKDVTVNFLRNFSSFSDYSINLTPGTFEDLAGNASPSGYHSHFMTTDFVAPTVTYLPAKGATNVNEVTTTSVSLTFSEAIRNLDNSAIDSYDLDSLVYFNKGTTPQAFVATLDVTNKIITITPTAALVKDATYTYGFKAKFEDAADNVTAAGSATFSTVTTSPAALYLSWTPAKAVAPATSTWLDSSAPITLNFSGPIFTYDAVVAANSNLPVTPAYLATILTVTKNTVPMAAADLVFTVIDSKTVSVAPKAGTTWGSGSSIVVSLAANTLQINEGNVTPIPADASTYNAKDTVAPIVDVTKTDATFTAGYHPANVGVAGVSPVIGKSDKLKLYFAEDVKVGTGTVEFYRWDGVLAKPAMMATVDATDKKLVTLGDLLDLPTNQEYYVIVNPGAVVDVTDSNPYAGITAVKTFKFKLMDDAIPQIISYLPNTTNIPVNTKLTISFDRPVLTSTSNLGYLALYKSAAGGDAVQLWRIADNGSTGAFTISGSTATVNISTLEANTQYFVELAGSSFASAADNTKQQLAIARSVWTFTTEVNDAPLAVTYSPDKTDPMVQNVPLNSGLTVTFDQDVVAGVGNIQLHQKQSFGGPIITNFDVADATKVTFNGKTMSIAGDVLNLQNNSEYYVIIPGTAVKNTSFTPDYYAGITVPLSWQFKTFNDIVGPTAVYAPKNTGSFPGDVKLTMTFNETPVKGTGNVKLYDSTDKLIETYTVASGTLVGKVLTFVPTVKLDEQTTYYVQADAGLVKDVWGNAYLGLADKTSWKFTTGDFTGPTVTVTPPATPVATVFTVGLKFNEPVSGVLGGVTVTGGTLKTVDGLGDSYTLTVQALEQTEVTIVLTDAIKDVSPNTNKFAGKTLTYKTGDFTAPTVVEVSPVPESVLANNHPVFKVTFNEDVKIGTGNLTVYKVNTTTPVLTLPISSAQVSGKVVTLTYTYNATTGGLDKDSRYYVLVSETAITDVAGNKFVGVSNPSDWTFKTGAWLTGIEPNPNSSLEFVVYPNPFVDYVNVKNASELSKVVVTNIAGQLVKEVVNPTERIQLNELRSGIYFMSLYNNDNVVVKTAKIVKR